MALTFDSSNCEQPTPLSGEESALRDTLALWLSFTGIRTACPETEGEYLFRLHIIRRVSGEFLDEDELRSELAVFRRWHGMRTNVSSETRSDWLRGVVRSLESRAEWLSDEARGVHEAGEVAA